MARKLRKGASRKGAAYRSIARCSSGGGRARILENKGRKTDGGDRNAHSTSSEFCAGNSQADGRKFWPNQSALFRHATLDAIQPKMGGKR
jgi:hypothetical protein